MSERVAAGLRSWMESEPNLYRWVQILPKQVSCGDDKDYVNWEPKLFGLDYRRVTLDKDRVGAIVVDMQGAYIIADLEARMLEHLSPESLPCMAVGERTGKIIKDPHFIWLLPVGSEIWPTQPNAMNFYRRIHRGLIQALLPLGADAGQIANPYKAKNPCCEAYSVVIFHEEWRNLHQLAPHVSLNATITDLGLAAAQAQDLVRDDLSQGLFHAICHLHRAALRAGGRNRLPEFISVVHDQPALAAWLRRTVTASWTGAGMMSDDAHRLIESCSE